MMKSMLMAGFHGAGVGIALLYANDSLPTPAYTINIPFWMAIVFPIGITWKQKFINKINKGEFPEDMKNYRQLFLSSRKAVVYDLILNQTIYHSGLAFLLILANYQARKFYDPDTVAKPVGEFFQDIALGFVKLRAAFTVFSYLLQFWGGRALLESKQGKVTMSMHSRHLLLMKQSLVQLGWMGSVMNLMHRQYPQPIKQ